GPRAVVWRPRGPCSRRASRFSLRGGRGRGSDPPALFLLGAGVESGEVRMELPGRRRVDIHHAPGRIVGVADVAQLARSKQHVTNVIFGSGEGGGEVVKAIDRKQLQVRVL